MPPIFSLANIHRQYLQCRRNKRNTLNALRFEYGLEENLARLREKLEGRSYTPSRSVCFFAPGPKLREIFAADFRDRVVHHVLVNHLERIWEPRFIHDSYACRRGKGVHAAVQRLQQFVRQATANGTRRAVASGSWGGWRLSTAIMSGGGGPRPGRPRRRRGLELAMLWCQGGAKRTRPSAYYPHVPSRGRLVSLLGWLLLIRLSWFRAGIRNQ